MAAGNANLSATLQAAGARANALHPALRSGDEALVLKALSLGASPSEPDENGDTPLHVAVRLGHGDILSLLLRQGVTVDALDGGGRSPVHLAAGAEGAGSLALVQRLVSAGADLFLRHGNDGKSALDWATLHGRVDVMRPLLQHDINVASDVATYLTTALHVGASSCQVGAIDLLIEAGADVDGTGGKKRETPLHVATRLGLSEAVVALLRHGADADKLNGDGCTALHLAAKDGSAAAVQALLAAGARPDLRGGGDNANALGLAAEAGHVDIVTALAQHGASLNAANEDGHTALHVATSNNAVAVVEVLVAAGADVNGREGSREETPLHVAIRLGLSEMVVALLRHGADTDKRRLFGYSVLHVAASANSSAAIVEALLAAGTDPNIRAGANDSTALGLAAEGGHEGVVETLVQHEVSLNAVDRAGRTPLHVATSKNRLPVIDVLLAAGVRVDVRDKDGKTPLHVACLGGCDDAEYPEAIAALMRYGAGSIVCTAGGKAPLHLTIEKGHVGATTALLMAGTDVNLRTKGGEPTLCVAAHWEHTDVLNVLIQHGADVKTTGSGGRTALHAAALRGEDDAIDELVAAGAELEAEDDEGTTPLLYAYSSYVSEALLKHGANVAKRDAEGRGVLHNAAHRGAYEVVDIVLAAGVDINLRDIYGCTALHLADSNCPGVVEALLEHAADIDARDSSLGTVLHRMVGVHGGRGVPSIEVLVSGGAATEARDKRGRTALHIASRKSNSRAMRALLRSGADLHAKDHNGFSPLHLLVNDLVYDFPAGAKGVNLLLRWGADETATNGTPSDDSDASGDASGGETAAELWEEQVETFRVSAANAAPVRKLLADAQKDRAWRRRGWLVLVRALPDRVRLKAENRSAAITGRGRGVRARGVAAAASDGAQAGTAPPRERPVRGLNGVVAGVVSFEEEGVFRNIVKFL